MLGEDAPHCRGPYGNRQSSPNQICIMHLMTKVMNQLDVNQDATTSSISHLAACGCVFVCVCCWGSRGPAGSPGRGELLRLSTLGELLLGETSLLLQLLVAEDEEALDTTKPGDRQPCREETDVV